MIDIEGIVFTKLVNKLESSFSGIEINDTYIDAPKIFPCVNIIEEDNYVDKNLISSTNKEPYANVMYSINIFSNSASGKKREAKQIAQVIDEEMKSMCFERTMKNEIPNVDRTIYRMVLRYEGKVADKVDGIYKVYSK